MAYFLPDPVTLEVLWQGEDEPCQVRLERLDGKSGSASFSLAELDTALAALEMGEPYGQALFHALLGGRLAELYRDALRASSGRGVRIHLRLDPEGPGLHRVRWERLFHEIGGAWAPMAAAPNVCFSRTLRAEQPWTPPLPAGPLRVLVVISSPFPPGTNLYVDVVAERAAVAEVFDRYPEQVQWEVLSGAVTAQQIADALGQGEGYDVLHYIGHGEWREDEHEAYLILTKQYEDNTTGPGGVTAKELGQIISACPCLPQLVYLSACESGQQSTNDAFTGLGPQIVRAGCPAVVCMQEKVEMAAARLFAARFYASLLEWGCVDLAVNRARAGLLESQYQQWSVPVLYMNLADGILFFPEQRFRPQQRLPYPFLKPYQPDDQDLFYGRKELAAMIEQRVCDQAVTVIYGEAGVGLTSLLEAGLRPRLEAGGWLAASLQDYADLASEFRVQLRSNGRPAYIKAPGDAPLSDLLLLAAAQASSGVALLLDQFERVFFLPPEQQQAVTQALENSRQALGPRLKLAVALHKDALGELSRMQNLFSQGTGEWIEVPPLGIDQAVEAMVEPLRFLNWPVTLTPGFARTQIASDLSDLYEDSGSGGRWVDPGHLQITCTWLYQKARLRQPPLIDEELYIKDAGGAEGILARYMEEELQARFGGDSSAAARVLVAMAAPDQERWVLPEQLETAGIPAMDLVDLLDRLEKAELLVRRLSGGRYVYAFANEVVAEEAVRLGGKDIERSYNAGDELVRAWRLWLAAQAKTRPGSRDADGALPTKQQLRTLADYGQHLNVHPIKTLLLLRAAVVRGEPVGPWLSWLAQKESESGLVRSLEDSAAAAGPGSSVRELAGRLLGLNDPDLLRPPQNGQPAAGAGSVGPVSWAAAASPDPIDRQTAALALAVLPGGMGEAVEKVETALEQARSGLGRYFRRAELLGVLADAEALEPGQPSVVTRRRGFGDRLGIYAYRVFRRILINWRHIAVMAFGSAIGGGLGLGIERLIVGILSQSPVHTIYFALFSYWGFVLAGATGLGIALAGPLRLENAASHSSSPAGRHRLAEVLLGAAGFWFANLIVAVLNNISLARAPLVIPLGIVAGFGLSLALAGLDAAHREPAGRLLGRAAIGGLTLALVQAVFVLVPQVGAGISISLSAGSFEVEFNHFQAGWWQAWMRAEPNWPKILSVAEAFLAGLALALGAVLGSRAARVWLQRWHEFLDRLGE